MSARKSGQRDQSGEVTYLTLRNESLESQLQSLQAELAELKRWREDFSHALGKWAIATMRYPVGTYQAAAAMFTHEVLGAMPIRGDDDVFDEDLLEDDE